VDTGEEPVFVKWNRGGAARGVGCEARALDALRRATADEGLLAVPGVLGWSEPDGPGWGWLALEYLPPTPGGPDYGERLGRGLAGLHRHHADAFGWIEDNRIGTLPQANPTAERWSDFWLDARLHPQLEAARAHGHFGGGRGERTDAALDDVIARTREALAAVEPEPASLLHGDLWGGNVHAGPGGRPVLIDPASYHGHREVDLAMSELFGGFPARYLDAYREAWPLLDGYASVRRPLYQLYYLLVHVNLFGGSYVAACRRVARDVLRGL
jgi:fructosamine-3-kinase